MADLDLSYELTRWYQSDNGKELRARVSELLPEILSGLPGTQHMQVDIGDEWPCLYKHGVTLDFHELFGESDPKTTLLKNSQDSVLLLHVLDASQDPHKILHVVDKLVAQSGHLVIVGFNPMSQWGVIRLLMLFSRRSPWRSHFYSIHRIRDWLKVLNYEVRLHTSIMHLPPLPARPWYRRLGWVDRLLSWLLPHWGAVNIIVAKRPMYPMTVIRNKKRIGKVVASPVEQAASPSSYSAEKAD